MQTRLSQVTVGQSAVIHSIEEDELFLKLMEMGFIPGEEVKVDQVAPFGDPIAVSVAGYQVSLRILEADKIWVDTLGPEASK